MSLIDTLERRLGRFAIPNLTVGLIACQVAVFVMSLVSDRPRGPEAFVHRLLLVPELVLEGQVWRLATFIVVPPFSGVIWALFYLYLFYLMGTALEAFWGAFRFNLYLLIGYVATVALSFATPDEPSSNGFIGGSVFLAFAYLFPEFQLSIFFFFPVKIKWLALLAWLGYLYVTITGDWAHRLMVLGTLSNFAVFFGAELVQALARKRRRMAFETAYQSGIAREYHHRCAVCGITDRTHPKMDFRYCSKCAGNLAYCSEHLATHEHAKEAGAPA